MPEFSLFGSILKINDIYFHGSAFDFKVGMEKIVLCYLSSVTKYD